MKKLVAFLLATVTFAACEKEYNAPVIASVGTLGSAVDVCTGAVINGTFKANKALTEANTITLMVDVSKPGTYDISSDTLKGIFFKGTGSFTVTGVQSVTILGAGTPTDSAALRFRVRYGTSSCTFLVKVDTLPGVINPPVLDYYPTTTNSNWSYDTYSQTGAVTDTAYVFSTGKLKTIVSSPYNIFYQKTATRTDSFFLRKNAGVYFNASGGTNIFTNGIVQATKVLKDNVAAGSSWADTFAVTVNGQNVLLKYDYTILAKAVPATINSFSWTDVIKVSVIVSLNNTGVFVPFQTKETWYARGVGLVYEKSTKLSSTPNTSEEAKLRRFVIFP